MPSNSPPCFSAAPFPAVFRTAIGEASLWLSWEHHGTMTLGEQRCERFEALFGVLNFEKYIKCIQCPILYVFFDS